MSNTNRRNKMFGYAILWTGATLLCAALAYMKGQEDDGFVNSLNQKILDVKLECSHKVENLAKNFSALREAAIDIDKAYERKIVDLCKETASAQDHCAKIRKSMAQLEHDLAIKKEPIKFSGPIQIEILRPTKKAKPLMPKDESPDVSYIPKKTLGKKKK